MPFYLFYNKKTKKYKEVFFHMNDEKIFNGDDNNEVGDWERRFFVPNASIDTKINPDSANDFIEKTGKKKGSLGNLLDQSKEASLKREKRYGFDPLKEKAIKKWKKETGKKVHPSEVVNIKNIKIE